MQNFKKYLPSKQFVASIITIIVIILLFFLVKGLFKLVKKINLKDKEPTKITIGELIQKDSNNNGIADWEESLWGLNPAKNGPENKEFILSKKKILKEGGEIIENRDNLTPSDNELLSRELLATIISLSNAGQLDEESIASISEALGEKIIAEEIPDKYFQKDLKMAQDSVESNKLYHNSFVSIYKKYENADLGGEITIFSQGLGNNDVQALRTIKTIATSYRSFSEELSKIQVPISLYQTHLKIINSCIKIADSIDGLSMAIADPILGARSMIQYNKYSEELYSGIEDIMLALQLE